MNRVIFAVGIGPGSEALLTPQAREVLMQCTAVAGYELYLQQLEPLLAGRKRLAGAMMQEIARCRAALDAVLAGETVAVVSSGDAGIYGMAGLLLELTEAPPYDAIEVRVIPGVTAALSGAALVGAPLMNDFAVVSLSDLMTPRAVIERRLRALAAADLTVALYNPASRKRRELLVETVAIFRAAGGNLPAAVIRDAGRPGETARVVRLDDFPFDEIQMTTLVIIGNSQTVVRGAQMYCRRGYREKYGFDA